MSATTAAPVNSTKLIGALDAKGRSYTDARNAVIGHVLATGTKQSVIVAESGVDKGDVSRINKLVTNLAPAKLKALKGLSLAGVDADNAGSIVALAKFGADNLRRVKAAPAAKGAASKTGEDESTDMRAVIFDYLVGAESAEVYAARLALVAEVIEASEQARADAQAELDAA